MNNAVSTILVAGSVSAVKGSSIEDYCPGVSNWMILYDFRDVFLLGVKYFRL